MGKKESEIEEKRKEKLHLYVNRVPKTKRKKEKKDRKNNLQYQKKKNHFLIDFLFVSSDAKHLLLPY